MKNFETMIDETYEFFDELLGSVVPGIYFCSYFAICMFAMLFTLCGNFELFKDHKYIALSILIIAYTIGTMCRRSNSREPDYFSARHIYFNSIPSDDNDFAFNPLVTDNKYNELIDSIKEEVSSGNIKIKLNNSILERKKKNSLFEKAKTKLRDTVLFLQNNCKKYEKTNVSKPYAQRYIYEKLLDRKKYIKKKKNTIERKNEINNIDRFINNYHLKESFEIYVDYPYGNLKNYLKNRKMDDLAKLVSWSNDDHEKTARSKSIICNMKSYIKHVSPNDYGQLLKTEAHIRFMNSIWYANKIISAISLIVLISSATISITVSLIYHFSILAAFKEQISPETLIVYNSLRDSFVKLFSSAFRSEFEWDKLLGALMFVIIISFGYRCLSRLIIRTIKNNFHYQRVREVVSVLYIYNLLANNSEHNKHK